MQIIGRTLIILAAALVVVGATWALAPTGDARSRPALTQVNGAHAGSAADAASTGERAVPPRRERGGGQGLFGIFDVVKNLVIISVIAALALLGMRVWRGTRFFARHE